MNIMVWGSWRPKTPRKSNEYNGLGLLETPKNLKNLMNIMVRGSWRPPKPEKPNEYNGLGLLENHKTKNT
jgi:hypothetical protein